MKNLRYEFLDPFMKEEIIQENITKKELLNEFKKINWSNLVLDYYYFNNNENKACVINDFWYFQISYFNLNGQIFKLLIVPDFALSEALAKKELKFSIEYFRPKNTKAPIWKKILGDSKKILKIDYSSCTWQISLGETIKMVDLFLEGLHNDLDLKITGCGPLIKTRIK